MHPIEHLSQLATHCREYKDTFLNHLKPKFKPKGPFKAHFANPYQVLSYFHHGFCLNGRHSISTKLSYQNAAVIGGTGAGKTSNTLIPSLFRMKDSYVINDPSQEIHKTVSGELLRKNYTIKVLNLSDATKGDGFNPLKRANTISQLNQVAFLMVRSTLGDAKDSFWNLQAQTLLTMIFKVLKRNPIQYRNLANARHLAGKIASKGEELKGFINDPEYETFLAYDQKVRGSIVATVMASLQLLADPEVERSTCYDTLDFQELRKRKTALFIHTSPTQVNYFKTLNSIFFEQLFQALLSKMPDPNELDVWFMLDEAGSSLLLPNLSSYIAQVRKYRMGMLLLLQSRNQLVANYGEHHTETILSNCYTQLYLSGQSPQQAKSLEQQLGMVEVDGYRRPLISVDEIRTLPTHIGLLLCGNRHPMKIELTPYYKHLLYQYQARFKPPAIHRELPFSQVPKLKLTYATDSI